MIGLGHLNRCLSLAKSLTLKKFKVIFLVSNNSSYDIVSDYDYSVLKIKNKAEYKTIKKLIILHQCDVLILDSKRSSLLDLSKKLYKKTKIISIDNYKIRDYVNLTILPGLREQFTIIPKNSLVGSKYILLNPNFKNFRKKILKKSIFISMGGSDKYNITEKVISSFLKQKSNFKFYVFLGKYNNHLEKLKSIIKQDKRFKIMENPKNFLELISTFPLGIISFGITVYEANALGVPLFVVSHSNENDFTAKRLQKYHLYKYFGKYNKINYDELAKEAILLINQRHPRKIFEKKIHGNGNKPIAHEILKLIK